MDVEIQTYWNVETLYYVFNAVASVINGAQFKGILKLTFLCSIAIGMFAFMGRNMTDFVMWFAHAMVFVMLLNLPVARVSLVDRSGLEPPRVVSNVPLALAMIAQVTNVTFGALTRTYETVFAVPDDLGLQKGDVGFGHRILKQVNRATIRDPGLRSDLMQFFKECTIYDLKDGHISPPQLIGGTDAWDVIFGGTSPARFVTYDTLTAQPQTATCVQAAAVLKPRVNEATLAAQRFYGKQMFRRAQADEVAGALFVSAVGTSYEWILNSTSAASDAMKQGMFNSLWREAGTELPTLLSDTARVAEVSALAGAAQAARQADGANSSMSLLAQETLPHMRNWIEAILYSLFPVVVVLVVASSTEGAKRIISGYLMSLAWIGLWPLLFAVVNHLSLMHLRYKAKSLELANGVPFQLSDAFDATLSNEQSMIGYMVVMVPFLAGSLIKLGQGGFTTVADRMVSGFVSGGAATGAGLASGNLSIGQTRLDASSVNSTSLHKYDGDMSLSGGGVSMGRADGSMATMSGNRTVALQQFQNRMLRQMSVDSRSEVARSEEAHRTGILSSGHQVSSRQAETASMNRVSGRDASEGTYHQAGTQLASTRQGGFAAQSAFGESLDVSRQEHSSMRVAAGANDQLGLNLGIHGSGAGGARGLGRSGTGRNGAVGTHAGGGGNHAADTDRIKRGLKGGGASDEQVDNAIVQYEQGNAGRAPPGPTSASASNSSSARAPVPGSMIGGAVGGISRGISGGISGGLSVSGTKIYSADHSRNRSVSTQHHEGESARTEQQFSRSVSESEQESAGEQRRSGTRQAQDAARSDIRERASVEDVSEREEYGRGDRVSRSETSSRGMHHDLLADPYVFAKVAARNGMSAMRFANQSQDRMVEMVQDYAAERQVSGSLSRSLPETSLHGDALPHTAQALAARGAEARRRVMNKGGSIESADAGFRKAVDASGDGARMTLESRGQVSQAISDTESSIRARTDREHPTSVAARTRGFDENVRAWASPDKRIGEGRANPAALTEDAMVRDGVDTVKKIKDRLSGGDGAADGERFDENMKREVGSTVTPRSPTGSPTRSD